MTKVTIDNGEPATLAAGSFGTLTLGLRKLFKHPFGFGGDSPARDEGWHELMDGLEESAKRRRLSASRKLHEVMSKLGKSSKLELNETPYLGDEALSEILHDSRVCDALLQSYCGMLSSYLEVANSVFQWAIDNPCAHGPRIIAIPEKNRPGDIRMVAVDNRGLKAVAAWSKSQDRVEMITCYRVTGNSRRGSKGKRPSYSENWLSLRRRAVGQEKTGQLLTVKVVCDA